MQVTLNGVPADLEQTATVASLVAMHGGEHRRVAVAVNGQVVPRSRWETTGLATGDSIEVLVPTAGG
ncbi:sulfur carrier protein ThiS [Blastococcus mobilis]|uniref:Sulfur carrier protein n=1 Tax=Blastococcus mobilis TaxID=1938746 RepID=A0A238Y9S8_9ACTN|nr:sulfur carrier protein ThiS [Blastococcus mobilis]SNR67780.1 sulfur carrier protein [Blastococcus mobilis]